MSDLLAVLVLPLLMVALFVAGYLLRREVERWGRR